MGANILTVFVGNVFAPLAALATAPLMAHSLGVDGRGSVAAATAPLLLATTLATLGIPAAVTYLVARGLAHPRGVFRRAVGIVVLSGLASVGIVVALAPRLAAGDESLARLIALAALAVVPSLVVALLQAVAAGLHHWRLVTAERLITAVVRLGAFVALALSGRFDVGLSIAILALSPIVGGFAYVGLLRRQEGGLTVADRASTNDLLVYGTRVWLGSITGVLLSRLDQTLVLPLSTAFELGLYVAAVSVGELPLVIVNAVRDVLFSSDASENDDERLVRASRLSTSAALVVSLLVAFSLPLWLERLFGDGFSRAEPVAIVLLAAVVLGNPGSLAGVALSARGRPGLRSLSLVVACAVNIALVIALVPVMGALGAALATLIGNMVAAISCLFLARRFCELSPLRFVGLRRGDFAGLVAVLGRRGARVARDQGQPVSRR